jgi:hypothetical protein
MHSGLLASVDLTQAYSNFNLTRENYNRYRFLRDKKEKVTQKIRPNNLKHCENV